MYSTQDLPNIEGKQQTQLELSLNVINTPAILL